MLFQFYGRFGAGFFQSLERFGFIDAIFPFALVFTVLYGILRKIKIFGKDASPRFDGVVALVAATAFVYPHLSGRYRAWGLADPVDIINTSIPQVGVIIIAMVMFLIMLGLVGITKFGALQQIVALASFFVVFGIFLNSAGYLQSPWLGFLSDPDLQAFIVIILVLGGLLYFLGDSGGGQQPGPLENFSKFMEKLVGKPD